MCLGAVRIASTIGVVSISRPLKPDSSAFLAATGAKVTAISATPSLADMGASPRSLQADKPETPDALDPVKMCMHT